MENKNVENDPSSQDGMSFSLAREFDKFIYLLSHDVRNAARAVIEIPQWIQEDMVDEGIKISDEMQTNFDMLDTQGRRLDKMLVDLLTYSRVGRKQNVKSVDLDEVVAEILSTCSIPEGFTVDLDLQCKHLEIGENDIIILFTEIILNSIRHHDKTVGKIDISSRSENNHCVICISDDGPGIEEKYQSQVFEVMKTLKTRDDLEGTGMGLATAKKIATYYGGTIKWLNDGSERGATIEIKLPL